MATTSLLIGVKGEKRTLEACGLYSEIRLKFREMKSSGESKGLDLIELWDKSSGVIAKHDFGKIARKQINLDGGINPLREDSSMTPEVDPDEMGKDELKKALDELGVEYDARLGIAKLRELYEDSVKSGE